ncbi:hypothetical protein OH686_14900 [Pseudomonas sp. SO81]|nr:hypothetical protein OH686_14900 [Pseudomonas sp. SO81]
MQAMTHLRAGGFAAVDQFLRKSLREQSGEMSQPGQAARQSGVIDEAHYSFLLRSSIRSSTDLQESP